MDGLRHVTGKEILQAIAHAKKSNPKDKYGQGAFQIDVANIKKTDMVRYVPVKIKVFCGKDDAGEDKWEFVPFHVRFRKVTTRNKIPTLQERQNSTIKSVTLQFRNTSKSYWNVGGKEEEDPIGEALDQAEMVIRAKIVQLLKMEKLANKSTTINLFVQRGKKDPDTNKIIEKFDEPIIRAEIKFRKANKDASNVEPTAEPWLCNIFDAEKPRPASQTPPGEPRFYPACVSFGEGEDIPINYGNIHTFIRGGSSITGFIDASQISLSGQGISLTPRFSTLIVKKSAGFKPTFNSDVWAGQLDDLGDAPVDAIEEDPSGFGGAGGPAPSSSGGTSTKGNADDFANEADEFGDDFGDGGDNGNAEDDGGDGLPEDDEFDDLE